MLGQVERRRRSASASFHSCRAFDIALSLYCSSRSVTPQLRSPGGVKSRQSKEFHCANADPQQLLGRNGPAAQHQTYTSAVATDGLVCWPARSMASLSVGL